jgi:hypothetical protein
VARRAWGWLTKTLAIKMSGEIFAHSMFAKPAVLFARRIWQ